MQTIKNEITSTEKQACILLSSLTGIPEETLIETTKKYGYDTMLNNPTLMNITQEQTDQLQIIKQLINTGGVE